MQPRRAGDADCRRRFLREAEITARLEHPGVVPVYGLVQGADGQPCYAMRFIEGQSFKDAIQLFHERDQKPGRTAGDRALALRELLGRFVAVCNTVAFAHSRGIIHRDLKPANVMLGPYGETLVVDWGLAKPVRAVEESLTVDETTGESSADEAGAETRAGQVVGTPGYMSPEQAAGDPAAVGPGSDVYSLGAILYHLLTGKAPLAGPDLGEVLRRARAGNISPPGQVKPGIPRALELICQRAMAARPEDRYAGALELKAEVERWLADEPVAAYREPLSARMARWGRRHRPVVAGAAALLVTAVVALGAGIAAVDFERQHTAEQRDQKQEALLAEARRRKQTRVALDAMSSQLIHEWLTKQKELLPEHKAFLRQALTYYEEFARDTGRDEESRVGVAAASLRVGEISRKLGQAKAAETAYRRSQELYERLAADYPNRPLYRLEAARAINDRGELLRTTGRPKEAEAALRAALVIHRQLVAASPDRPEFRKDLAGNYDNLGNLLDETGRSKEAETAYRRALALQQRLAADFPKNAEFRTDLARSQNNLATLLVDTGRLKEAEAAHRAALAIYKELVASSPGGRDYRFELAASHHNLASVLQDAGRPEDAEAGYRAALALYKQLAAEFPGRPDYRFQLAGTHTNLGSLLYHTSRHKPAEAAYLAGLALQERLVADFPNRPDYRLWLARSHNNLGTLFAETGRPKEAEAAYRAALALYRKLAAHFPRVPDYHNELAVTLNNLADEANHQGKYLLACRQIEEAEHHCRVARQANSRHPLYRTAFSVNRYRLAEARLGLGEHHAAAAANDEMLRIGADPVNDLYDGASMLSRCAGLAEKDTKLPPAKRREVARGYGDRAMALLHRAVAKGYNDLQHIKQDKDLDALRARPEFQKLLTDMGHPKSNAVKK
jgi:serine/threonine-protein kinase